ncbi:hypothetical protein DITRI_Ditri04bG0106300 [Diplodiscus trichospermus]
MASTCNRFISRSSSSIKSAFRSNGSKSSFSRSAAAPTPTRSPLPSQSPSPPRLFSFSRCPSELGCAQSLLPLHSAVAAARMTSCISTTSRSCRALSQGIDFTKLEIHGTLAMISHAILDDQTGTTFAVTHGHRSQMFRKNQTGNSDNQGKSAKPSSAIQRERTKTLILKTFENNFNLPIDEAAKRFEISATAVKKISLKYGVARWPHRKIQSMEKKISNWASRLTQVNDPQERARAEKEIQSGQREIAKFGEARNNQAIR